LGRLAFIWLKNDEDINFNILWAKIWIFFLGRANTFFPCHSERREQSSKGATQKCKANRHVEEDSSLRSFRMTKGEMKIVFHFGTKTA